MGASGAKVLVVDDEPMVRDLLDLMLRGDGHDVTVCADAAEALEVLGRERFDLVLTDHSMPGMSGCDLAREIKRREEAPAVALLTGYGDTVEEAEGDCPIDRVIGKPFSVDSLRAAVAALLQS
jgi:CheY-like chemotaxis protein